MTKDLKEYLKGVVNTTTFNSSSKSEKSEKRILDFGCYKVEDKTYHLTVDFELKDEKNLSICGSVKQGRNYVCGGQCLDDYLAISCNNYKNLYKVVSELWNKYHLNDLHAGTTRQTKALNWLKENNKDFDYDYGKSCNFLEDNGLLVDKVDGQDYTYGHSWLFEKIPDSEMKKIRTILDTSKSIKELNKIDFSNL